MAYRLKRGPKLLAALVLSGAAFAGVRYALQSGLIAPTMSGIDEIAPSAG